MLGIYILVHHWKWFLRNQDSSVGLKAIYILVHDFSSLEMIHVIKYIVLALVLWVIVLYWIHSRVEPNILRLVFPIHSTQLWVPNSCRSLLKKLAMKTLTWQCCNKLETFLKENDSYEVYRKTNIAFTLQNLLAEV